MGQKFNVPVALLHLLSAPRSLAVFRGRDADLNSHCGRSITDYLTLPDLCISDL